MRYYKWDDADFHVFVEFGMFIYFEVNKNNIILRQIASNGEIYLASNVIQTDGNMYLGDQPFESSENDEDVISITKDEFEDVWSAHLKIYEARWSQIKQTYPVGTTLQGLIHIFFPQGVIVNLGNNVLGVADYKACLASTKREFMYTRNKITAVVAGYDEENQWLILDSPQVHGERV
jgi:hypothetical protein